MFHYVAVLQHQAIDGPIGDIRKNISGIKEPIGGPTPGREIPDCFWSQGQSKKVFSLLDSSTQPITDAIRTRRKVIGEGAREPPFGGLLARPQHSPLANPSDVESRMVNPYIGRHVVRHNIVGVYYDRFKPKPSSHNLSRISLILSKDTIRINNCGSEIG